jgi:nicotinamide-nucleotide amidase
VRAEIVAVGTELLLGQIADTNSTWIGQQLAAAGIDCNYATKVGDNLDRIVLALRTALARGDAVIACGGLGPTQDDITREAIAAVMGVQMHRDEEVVQRIAAMFSSRGRVMSDSNLRQADVPDGAQLIMQTRGTAPGLICPVGHKVIYAVPGVPYEMRDMVQRAVLSDLSARADERGERAVIRSRTLRTWGLAESALGELVAPRFDALETSSYEERVTIAFLASGIEGIKIRLTSKAKTDEAARAALDAEEKELRGLLGDVVFGLDDETMEMAVARLMLERHLTLAVAESLTGGLASSRLVSVPGASEWYRGGVVAYSSDVKRDLLGVPEGVAAVSAQCAITMAAGVRTRLGSEVGLSTTGVAGPTEQDGRPPGTVFVGLALPGTEPEAVELRLPGDRDRIREYSSISAFDLLRRRL